MPTVVSGKPIQKGRATMVENRKYKFRGKKPEEYSMPDLNPHLKLHRKMVPPVVVAEEAPGFKGKWGQAFPNPDQPLHLEIGPGNGFYLAGMAKRHPDLNWLGIEIRFKRVVLVAKKINAAEATNARIARYDAWQLQDLFVDGELDGLHINFPDPWKHRRGEKHRLMRTELAVWAASVLKPGGEIRMKSDHRPNLERVVDACADLPISLVDFIDDIDKAGAPWSDDLVTNYQSKFNLRGEPIYAALLRRDG
jgi:tRNA (guanine-N7-)-methyltransferase